MDDKYEGSLIRDGTITGNLSLVNTISGELSDNTLHISGELIDVTVIEYEPEKYGGSYEIMPKIASQTFDTDNKLMTDDLTVLAIPVTYTSNPQGGKTVLIG